MISTSFPSECYPNHRRPKTQKLLDVGKGWHREASDWGAKKTDYPRSHPQRVQDDHESGNLRELHRPDEDKGWNDGTERLKDEHSEASPEHASNREVRHRPTLVTTISAVGDVRDHGGRAYIGGSISGTSRDSQCRPTPGDESHRRGALALHPRR